MIKLKDLEHLICHNVDMLKIIKSGYRIHAGGRTIIWEESNPTVAEAAQLEHGFQLGTIERRHRAGDLNHFDVWVNSKHVYHSGTCKRAGARGDAVVSRLYRLRQRYREFKYGN